MEAIVLSRSASSDTFLLWCSDQGSLAVLPFAACGTAPPQVGDLLSVILQDGGEARFCSSYRLIAAGALPEAADLLREAAARPVSPPQNRRFLSLASSG